ncbi:hypothetical protein CR513_40650, partial [Mucuna pruriens]
MYSHGLCNQIQIVVGVYSCMVDAYVLDVGGLDLISSGDVLTNWDTMTMRFIGKSCEVHKLLQMGIIKLSNSVYSSLVLLLKKKDNT